MIYSKEKPLRIFSIVLSIVAIMMVISIIPDLRLSFALKNADSFNLEELDSYSDIAKQNKSIFMVGESHGMDKTYAFLNNLIKSLDEMNKVDYLAFEFSTADAELLNYYIQNGDKNAMIYFLQDWSGTSYASQEFIDLLKHISELKMV